MELKHRPVTRRLRILLALLTTKERSWLRTNTSDYAMRYKRMILLLNKFPNQENSENILSDIIFHIIRGHLAWKY